MTKKAEAGKTERKKVQIVLPDLLGWASQLYRTGVLGVLVLSLAVVTFVGLIQESSGFLIDWWSDLLLRGFGWGSYVVTLLELVPGVEVVNVLDACCGMGGSYGMKAAHYDLSVKIAQKLWGELEEADVETVATECGTCMLQIEACRKTKTAVHPIVLVNEAYKNFDAAPRHS